MTVLIQSVNCFILFRMKPFQIKKPHGQVSDSIVLAVFLTVSGGLQDAYSYMIRGNVFANAQTGNIVLMSARIFKGDIPGIIRYLIPLLFFAFGIFICQLIRMSFRSLRPVHWRQIIVAAEVILLFFVGFMPPEMDLIANSMISFSCAMQVQAFRKLNGNSYATTMCIGNIRSGMESLAVWFRLKNRSALRKAFQYFSVILLFAFGAGIGSVLVRYLGQSTIWVSCALLFIGFIIMFIKEDLEGESEQP